VLIVVFSNSSVVTVLCVYRLQRRWMKIWWSTVGNLIEPNVSQSARSAVLRLSLFAV